jgi:hypothetical protein
VIIICQLGYHIHIVEYAQINDASPRLNFNSRHSRGCYSLAQTSILCACFINFLLRKIILSSVPVPLELICLKHSDYYNLLVTVVSDHVFEAFLFVANADKYDKPSSGNFFIMQMIIFACDCFDLLTS